MATTAGGSAFIGERTPLIPSGGALFVAYAGPALQERWLAEADEGWRDRLAQIRDRGYSVALRSPAHAAYDRLLKRGEVWQADGEPTEAARRAMAALPYDPPGFSLDEVHSFHAPVFGADGRVAMSLNALVTSRQPRDRASLERCLEALLLAAERVNSSVDR
jgi:DNA-binding IclR family transcriptional regulator